MMDAHLQYKCRNCGERFSILKREIVKPKDFEKILIKAITDEPVRTHDCGSKFDTTFGVADLIHVGR